MNSGLPDATIYETNVITGQINVLLQHDFVILAKFRV